MEGNAENDMGIEEDDEMYEDGTEGP